jgi:hypothetical protein
MTNSLLEDLARINKLKYTHCSRYYVKGTSLRSKKKKAVKYGSAGAL